MLEFIKDIDLGFKIPTPDKSIKVAVTGMSRSGKTVFLTSLINQLLANDKLPYLNEKLKRKFVAKILPPDSIYMRFDYYNKLNAFRKPEPVWPKSTKAVSKTTIQLEFKSEYNFLENQIVNLELIDYPGEWLLDLAMLDMSYKEWSELMISLAQKEPRVNFSREWLMDIKQHSLYKRGDTEQIEEQLFDLYSEYLKSLYYHDFSFIQPGRFIEPGDMRDDPILVFSPLPTPINEDEIEDGSIYANFKARYEIYVSQVVKKLYLEHFKSFDSQIILVDLVKTLNKGEAVFNDMHLALKNILKSFTYGSNNIFSKFFDLKIDHVLFAATKADHIPLSQHESYKKLLEEMIWDIKMELDVKHIDTEVTIFSSVKSTEFVRGILDGVEVDCVRGVVIGESEPSTHFPGFLPKDYKNPLFWKDADFHFVSFKPARFPQRDINAVEHIRMDRLLYSLLKDRV